MGASGISDGSHILNDDRYYDAFIAEEYAAFEDRAAVERVADELIAWLDSESEVR